MLKAMRNYNRGLRFKSYILRQCIGATPSANKGLPGDGSGDITSYLGDDGRSDIEIELSVKGFYSYVEEMVKHFR